MYSLPECFRSESNSEPLRWNIRVRSHERRIELKPVWDFISVESFTSLFSQVFTCVHMNWGEIRLKTVWISYRSFWQKWHFISGDKISCKHHPKWNAYTCPSKYRVTLKCSRNETSCEQNLFSRRFEISNRYEFISPLMWTYSKTDPLAKIIHGYCPSTIFIENSISDVPLSLNTTLQIGSHINFFKKPSS